MVGVAELGWAGLAKWDATIDRGHEGLLPVSGIDGETAHLGYIDGISHTRITYKDNIKILQASTSIVTY